MREKKSRRKSRHNFRVWGSLFFSLLILILPILAISDQAFTLPLQHHVSNEEKIAKMVAYGDTAQRRGLPPFPKGELQLPVKTYEGAPVPIIMYHHIQNYNNPNDPINTSLSMPVEAFRSQLRWLKDTGYKTITLRDLFVGRVPAQSVVLTFDDGFQDNYDNAYQMLRENGQTGVFFVISSYLNSPAYMTSGEVRTMSDAGMDIESHTMTHPDLASAGDRIVNWQLEKSKADIEAITGKKVEFLCYPSGRYDESVISITKRVGYRAAVTTKSWGDGSMYELPRIRMSNSDGVASIRSKIEGFLDRSAKTKWVYR